MSTDKCLYGQGRGRHRRGRGIGREIALLCARKGKVVVNDLGGSADGEGAGRTPILPKGG